MGVPRKITPSFDAFYTALYGDRWPSLRTALSQPREPVEFSSGLLHPYYLDEGSLLAVGQLPVLDGDTVLDMCAAPGGKSLVLATKLPHTGTLVSNDRSSQRRIRLRRVLDEHLPHSIRERVTVTSHDATRWGLYEQNVYDSVLLDAPCSSERHVLQDPKALAQWSPARTKHLAIQQFAMLAAALEAVKIGGYILYSTCSISPHENEAIIAKLEKKRQGKFEEIALDLPIAEQLSHGSIIMPDRYEGRGPLYFCLLRRVA